MSTPRIRFIDLLLLVAAVLAMLLSAPSLHAKTTHKKKTIHKKTYTKKVKISFDGPSSSINEGELGDEIPAPQIADRDFFAARSNVKLRGNSIDELWSHSNSNSNFDEPASKRSKRSKNFIVAKSQPRVLPRRAPVTRKQVLVAANKPVATPALEFDEVKSVPAKTPARPVTRTYVRGSTPVASMNHLATNVTLVEPSQFDFNFALETTVTLGRKFQLETKGERNYAMKNEVFVGTNHSSGWGAKLSASFISTSNDDSKKDERRAGDPSMIVSHPSIYKTRDLDLYGRVRYYAPVSTPSRASGVQHFAYFLLADLQLPDQMIVSNAFIPRYFFQSSYKDSDAFVLVYDSTELTRKFDWFRVGVGQQTQIESHEVLRPGTTVEAYPFIDYIGIPNALLQAKLYIPLYVDGPVGGGPNGTSLANIQAEFFAKLAF